MAKKKKEEVDPPAAGAPADSPADTGTSTATAKPKRTPRSKPKPPRMMPPWKVLLHNDDINEIGFVIDTIVELTPLDRDEAILRSREANDENVALLLVTHKERAELYMDQFKSKGLIVTIESAED